MQILFSLLISIQTIYITGNKIFHLFAASTSLSAEQTVTQQERSVPLHTMLGKCSGTTGEKVNGFSSRLRTGTG